VSLHSVRLVVRTEYKVSETASVVVLRSKSGDTPTKLDQFFLSNGSILVDTFSTFHLMMETVSVSEMCSVRNTT
jgi:hypothetical protein